MSELSLSLTEAYKQRYDAIACDDSEHRGIYYHADKKYWIIYDYQLCSRLLNSPYVTKKRMMIPLSMFDEEKTVVERFLLLINQSLIFRDEGKSDIARIIHQNFKNTPCDELIKETLSSLNRRKYLDEHDLITLNNTLAARLVGLESPNTLEEHAHNVGMLFDGRIQGKEHFVQIARSFLTIFDTFRNQSTDDVPCSDISASDKAIAYIAAHQTTMQLIVAAFWAISHFNLKVDAENARDTVIEASRLYSPVLSVGRVISQDTTLSGQNLKKGDRVMFYTGLANFDPEVFEEPLQFILGRKERPLSFGTGVHMCIGMGIALSFASSFMAEIGVLCLNKRVVSITDLAEGVSALGASRFNIGMDCHELAES
ncbi:cytochrome P450 [Serratia nevei]|uniref:cytochrome P450 n=1 Tax=Serratia nevei TaxID=2703794 RepID=UPI0020A14EBD|nr:cytochrome P450 [Serratia nevei]MCP1107340.1 cytochrome P450 [Serratia nevei]